MLNPKPRIAYLLKKFPRLSETFILNELLGLEALGLDVEVVSLHDADDEPRHADLGNLRAPIHRLHAADDASWPAAEGASEQVLVGALRAMPDGKGKRRVAQARALAQLAGARGFTHVHAHFMTVAAEVAAVARMLGGPPFTVTAHAKDIFRSTVRGEVFAAVAALSGGLVTVTEFNRNYIAERFLGGDRRRVQVIYNGLPLDDGEFDIGKRCESRRPLLLGVGRLVAKKGFDDLVRAAAGLARSGRDFDLVLAGDGDDRGRLETMVDALGIAAQTTFTGAIPREAVFGLMRRAAVFALPCRTSDDGNRDALPTVLIEALALGVPVVSTRLNGIPEIVDHDVQGLLVDEGDSVAFEAALARLLDDASLRRRLGAAGPAKARRAFDRAQTLPRLVELFARASRRDAVA